MRDFFIRFIRDESGATAIEYGLIAAGIAVAVIATVKSVGGDAFSLLPAAENLSHSENVGVSGVTTTPSGMESEAAMP